MAERKTRGMVDMLINMGMDLHQTRTGICDTPYLEHTCATAASARLTSFLSTVSVPHPDDGL